MKLSALTAEIKDHERHLAHGSETSLWGDYCERMRQVTGHLPYDDHPDEVSVSDDEAQWWLTAYQRYEDQGGDVEDLQAMYDSIA